MELSSLLAEMVERKASDLHLVAGVPPLFRILGELAPAWLPNTPRPTANSGEEEVERLMRVGNAARQNRMANLSEEDVSAFLRSALPKHKLAVALDGRDFSATLRQDDETFRCQVFRSNGALAAAIRILPKRIPTLEEMHLPPVIEKLTHLMRGLVLIVGPTGSGKTTTVVSMLEQINMTRPERIYTLEDPLNYMLSSKLSLVTQRIVGEDVESYESGLLSIKDADPDVVFIGEMRTSEVVRLALEIAYAGVLVFSQMTADTVSDAIEQLVEMVGGPRGSAQRLVARTLQAVVAQKLLVRADRQGRVAANEILLSTAQTRQMISDGQTAPELLELVMSASRSLGMQTMDDALLNYYADGVISCETAVEHLADKSRLG